MAVIDCDYPQHSISKQRIRDQEAVRTVPAYQSLFIRQSEQGITPYPVLISNPMDGIDAWKCYEAASGKHYDAVLFDLPGTVNVDGVLSAIMRMDYLFVPMRADRIVLESTLNFATTLHDQLITTGVASIKELYLFWNMVDKRERNRLYESYEEVISRLGLQCFRVRIPVRSNFTKDLSPDRNTVYRSTLLPPDAAFVRECGLENLMMEILKVTKLTDYAEE